MPQPNRAYFIAGQAGIVPIAIAEPGTAKTACVEAFTRFLGRHLEVVIGSQRDPAEIAGYPYPTATNGHTSVDDEVPAAGPARESWFVNVLAKTMAPAKPGDRVMDFIKPLWQHRAETAPAGSVVFFDECNCCEPAKQAAMLYVMQKGIPNSFVLAAGNPPECAANGFDLEPPMVNRLYWHDWDADVQSWLLGLSDDFASLSAEFPVLPDNWRSQIPHARNLMTTYLRRTPHRVQVMPDVKKARSLAGKPWPSKRSWTNGATLHAAALSLGDDDSIAQQLYRGTVGEAAAAEYFTYLRDLDLPDVEEWLADPSKIKLPDRDDRRFAATSACVAAVLGKNTKPRWERCWEVLLVIAETAKDVALAAAQPLCLTNNIPAGAHAPAKSVDSFLPTLQKVWPKGQ